MNFLLRQQLPLWIGLLSGFGLLSTHAVTTNLAVVADTFINAGSADNNAGGNEWFDAGRDGLGEVRRGLLRFDLTAIPPGSTVTSAALQLTVIKVPGNGIGAVNSTFDLFRLTTGWNEGSEGGASGNLATTGEATWNARMDGNQPWTSPGARSDVVAVASASTLVNASLGATYSWSGTGVVNDVQFWIDQPAFNMGWLLVSENESAARTVRGFAARENNSGHGVLQLSYSLPPGPNPARITKLVLSDKFPSPPLTLTNVPVISNGLVTLTCEGNTNGKFDLLFSSSLQTNPIWTIAEANIPAAPSGSKVVSDPPYLASPAYRSNSTLFYRLESLPPPVPALGIRLQVVASNLVSPTVLTHAGDGSGRVFIADQPGQVWIVDNTHSVLPSPFLDVANRMAPLQPDYDERGLLGLAFHPGYSTNGRFFVYYSAPSPDSAFDNQSVLSEFKVSAANSDLADPGSERVLLSIAEPAANQEGGALVFGPDGYLYVGCGDGGGAGDQHGTYGNGQVLTNLLGKILRLDVDSGVPYSIPADNPFVSIPTARPEIYAYGLRNPWRFSFDRGGTRQGFIADVGQNLWEELDILRKSGNYGWRIMEGNHIFDATVAEALGVNIPSLDFPVLEYGHGPLGISIVGGFVYRGTTFQELAGKYVFGDFSTTLLSPDGQLYYLDQTRAGIWERFSFQLYPNGGRLGRFVKGFGEDEAGELYLLSTTTPGPTGKSGDVRQLVRP